MHGIGLPLRERLLAQLAAVDAGQTQFVLLAPPTPAEELKGRSQALFFLKPELLYPELDRALTIATVSDVLAAASITVGGVAVLGPERLAETVAAHYGVINRVSRLGAAALPDEARARLEATFGAELAAGVPCLGGSEVVDRYGVGPHELEEALSAPAKLAPGTYAALATVGGTQLLVLNGFHPAQLGHYSAPRSRIVALEIHWAGLSWKDFRNTVVGATRPEQADPESVRGVLLTRQDELAIRPVAVSTNGVHGSAGPVEAMVEVARFLEVAPAATALGSALLDAGVSPDLIEKLASADPESGALRQQVFDATEEVDPPTAIEHLTRL